MSPRPPSQAHGRLDSWKEIASYLKRDVRTVQRWEKREGLPIRRHTHDKRPSVYAFEHEIDLWWRKERRHLDPDDESPREEESAGERRFRARLLAGVISLACTAAGIVFWLSAYPPGRQSARAGQKRLGHVRYFARAASEESGLTVIPLDSQPECAAITPGGEEIYVSNPVAGTVTVVRSATNTVSHVIPVGVRPHTLTVSPDGRRVYVANSGGDVSAISTRDKVVQVLPAGGSVGDLALTPDGRRLYVAMLQLGLKRIDTASGSVTTVSTGPCPARLAIAQDGKRMFVNYQCAGPGGSPGHDAIDVFDLPSERVVATVRGLPNVGGPLAFTPDGSQVWANGVDACFSPAYDHGGCLLAPGSVVHVLRASDQVLLGTIAAPGSVAHRVSFSPDGTSAFIGRPHVSLDVLDTASLASLESLPADTTGSVVFTPNGKRAYAVLSQRSALAVLESSGLGCAPELDGLVAAWPADGMVNETRGFLHSRLEEGAGFAPGRIGQAFSLDGVRGSVVADVSALSGQIQSEFSIAAWIKLATDRPSEMSILDAALSHPALAGWRLFLRPDRRVGFCLGGASSSGCASPLVSRRAVQPAQWVHLAGIRSAGALSLFIDGELEAFSESVPRREGRLEQFSQLRIGADCALKANWKGLIDEVQIYNRALRDADVRALRNGGDAGCGN